MSAVWQVVWVGDGWEMGGRWVGNGWKMGGG